MEREPRLWGLLRALGCRRTSGRFILDGFDHEFYLLFDTDEDPDSPDVNPENCDIHLRVVGSHPKDVPGDGTTGFRVVKNARESHVLRFMFALGVHRFSEETRKALYEHNRPVRAT